MNKKISLKKNLIYQSFYRILTIFTPLITSPYLSRVLGAEKLGIYSYTLSIVSYFTMFAFLGTETYGNRTIAQINTYNDREKLSKTFWGIYIVQAFCSSIAVTCYILFILLFVKENKIVSLIQGIWILSTLLDINWFFFGIEEVKLTVIRNSIVKVVGIVLIILFVKCPDDLLNYAIIMSGTMLVSQMLLWGYMPRYIVKTKISSRDILKHVKPNIGLFIPLIASSVFWTMDKTMLGLLSDYHNTGCYYNADKVMNIPLNLVIGFGAVMLPRMSAMLERKNIEEWNRLFKKTSELYFMLSCAIGAGIAAVSQEFVPIFFGDGYDTCILLIELFGPILVLKALNDMVKNQCILPLGQEKNYTYIVLVGAVSNFIVNILLIPKLGALGALIGTGVAEIVVVVMELIIERKFLKISIIFGNNYWYVIFGVVTFAIVKTFSNNVTMNIYIKFISEIVIGSLFYGIGCLIYLNISKKSIIAKDLKNRNCLYKKLKISIDELTH